MLDLKEKVQGENQLKSGPVSGILVTPAEKISIPPDWIGESFGSLVHDCRETDISCVLFPFFWILGANPPLGTNSGWVGVPPNLKSSLLLPFAPVLN